MPHSCCALRCGAAPGRRATAERGAAANGPQWDVGFRGAFATETFGSYDEPEDEEARRQLTTQYRPQPGRSPMRRM